MSVARDALNANTAPDIMSAAAIRDPQGYLATLRREQPVYWDPRYRSWLVTSYRLVSDALRDERISSDRIAPYIRKKLSGADTDPLVRQAFEVLSGWMVFKEEPAHTRLRRLCAQAFTPKSIAPNHMPATAGTSSVQPKPPGHGPVVGAVAA